MSMEGEAGYGAVDARLDDLVSATSVSFDGASFKHGVAGHAPAAAAAVTVGVQCGTESDGPAYGYEGSTSGGTYGMATIAPATTRVERTPWPRTIECVAAHELTHHELAAQHEAGFQVGAVAFAASQISVPSAAGQYVAQTACRPGVGCGVPPFGFGKPAIGALAVLSLFQATLLFF
ncbi:hypothetical protein CYMTET_50584 [Cymbomonas tetramitiformis]|uniref:Uncharacterized protein n=1 Tax=Cymbomonas tetramitiformis TaxID=36881 RepID=A0AAE0BMZ3_9CHLO|nr:hypothetical protein CYMTET_50584 [Cymbomonas tetramitiformis]